MKRFILNSILIAFLLAITLYALTSVMVDGYNNSMEFLCNNTVATSNPLGF